MTDTQERYIALGYLMDILEDGRFSHLVLREGLAEHQDMDERGRAFITKLVEGTVEYCILIDYVLNAYSKIKVKKMKPLIRNILRMGAYQLLFLDKVPESAAINEAVKLAKKRGLQGLAGYVNAVLRSIAREKSDILGWFSDEGKGKKAPLYVRYSLPEWLFNYLRLVYGKEEAGRIGAYYLSDDKGTYVRTSEGKTEKRLGNVADSEEFRTGKITVQDYASQQVGNLANPEKGSYILDVCAAPGGKACHMAALLGNTGTVDARDVSEDKVAMIKDNADRLKLRNIHTKVWDARTPDLSLYGKDKRGIADIVLCDAPCSGLGIIGKKPDIRFSASLENIKNLQTLQREILKTVTSYCKPGGRFIYSTCTLTKEENEQNTAWIQSEFGFTLVKEEKFLPGNPSDGFYIAEFTAPEV